MVMGRLVGQSKRREKLKCDYVRVFGIVITKLDCGKGKLGQNTCLNFAH